MKKFYSIFALLCVMAVSAFAKEVVWFDASALAGAEVGSYTFDNWEISSKSGYYNDMNLFISKPTENGLPFMTTNAPKATTSYTVTPPFSAGLTEANTGTGYIDNAADIKSITVTGKMNRPYDTIYLLYSDTPFGEIHKVRIKTEPNTQSMVDFTFTFDNPNYQPDISKRDITVAPVVNDYEKGLYLRGFEIETHAPYAPWAYSPYSIVYINKITVTVDEAFTPEQIEERKAQKELFGLNETASIYDKEKDKVKLKSELRIREESLEHKD